MSTWLHHPGAPGDQRQSPSPGGHPAVRKRCQPPSHYRSLERKGQEVNVIERVRAADLAGFWIRATCVLYVLDQIV